MHRPLEVAPDKRFAALDGWRGICALLVAVLHFEVASNLARLPLIANATLFVDFFFVLSGFVLSAAYTRRLATPADAVVMLRRRFARLWPLHMVLLLAFIALELATAAIGLLSSIPRRGSLFNPADGFSVWALPTHVALLHSMGLHGLATWNFPSWSISAEFWTAAVFAALMLAARQVSTWAAIAVAGLGALVVVTLAPEMMNTHYDYGFFRCLFGFFVGHLTHAIYKQDHAELRFPTLCEAFVVAGVMSFVCIAGFTIYAMAAPFVFAVAIWVFAEGRGRLSTALRLEPLQKLGRWSYSIYLTHALVVLIFGRAVTVLANKTGLVLTVPTIDRNGPAELIALAGPFAMDLVTIAYLTVIIAISAWTWRRIEMPAQTWINAGRIPDWVTRPLARKAIDPAAVTEWQK